ncbi:MAG: metallophosphoesterase [Selenomonadaceae bacterium]|nr:metallophosphoesterase [Selenomonadaceae bacterium]MBR4696592.1 metallophosphoesterase [Selenomonadaceae bacterium]
MRIGIVSDTHGNTGAVEAVLEMAPEVELWLHAGDFVDDARYLEMRSNTGVVKVAGNGDWPRSDAPDEIVVEAGGHRIFLTHGHTYGVNYGTEQLEEAAGEAGCDIAVYGHTHKLDRRSGKVCILNPGSASRPRDEMRPSFMTAELLPGKEPEVKEYRMEI